NGTLGALTTLVPISHHSTIPTRVGAAPDGGFVAMWVADADYTVSAARMSAAGTWTPPFQVNQSTGHVFLSIGARPLFRSDKSFSLLWIDVTNDPSPGIVLRARSYDSAGNPLGDEVTAGFEDSFSFDAVADTGGNTLVVSSSQDPGTIGRLFDRFWHPL